jgi:hypothetical protein
VIAQDYPLLLLFFISVSLLEPIGNYRNLVYLSTFFTSAIVAFCTSPSFLEKKTLWETILSSSKVESSEFGRLEKERQYIESEIRILNTNKGKNEERGYFKQLVRDEISHKLFTKIFDLFDELRQYGIFIVQVGALEVWLKEVPGGNSDEEFISLLNKIDKTQSI